MKEIFVFGSNPEGRHGAGAAKHALERHGAIYGQPIGLQGSSYAIITKELRRDFPPVPVVLIAPQVTVLIAFAVRRPDLRFNVTPIGCGLAGFKPEQIAPMFANAPDNVVLPVEFTRVLEALK